MMLLCLNICSPPYPLGRLLCLCNQLWNMLLKHIFWNPMYFSPYSRLFQHIYHCHLQDKWCIRRKNQMPLRKSRNHHTFLVLGYHLLIELPKEPRQ